MKFQVLCEERAIWGTSLSNLYRAAAKYAIAKHIPSTPIISVSFIQEYQNFNLLKEKKRILPKTAKKN